MNTLFNEQLPGPVSSEPPVWVRRIVLLRTIEGEPDIIRDIPFELGLNLIVTRPPGADSREAVGHDVGKTLLTRLIRYLLGEARYAEGRTRTAIRRVLPDSFVVGEFRVGEQDWAVMRPLGAPAAFLTRARPVQSWRELLIAEGTDGEFEQFIARVTDSVLKEVSSPLLTHAHRPVEWLDVLAWIARDQKCRYSEPLEWRHTDSDSGTKALLRADACSVLRSVAGLMNEREKVLFEEHDALLRRRQEVEQDKRLIDNRIDAENVLLAVDLRELLGTQEVGISQIELEIIRKRAGDLRSLRADEIRKLDLVQLRSDYEIALSRALTAEAQATARLESINSAEFEIKKLRERPATVHGAFADMCEKPVDDCPAKLKILHQKVPAPSDADIDERQATLARHREQLAGIQARLPDLRSIRDETKTRLGAAEEQVSKVSEGVGGKIAIYADVERRITRHLERVEQRPAAIAELTGLNEKLNASLATQAQLRESLLASREWLGNRFANLCSTMLGTGRRFNLIIESKAVALQQANADGAPGEATSTSALVLCLDLAAMYCATEGNGHHPRLVILDSPREADMEIAIFHRLLEQLASWHSALSKPAFQVIMTTTTRPPSGDQFDPYIRDELSRVPVEETLLRINF